MNNTNQPSESPAKNKALLVIGWIVAVGLIIVGLAVFFSHAVSGIFFILAGAILLPPVGRILKEKVRLGRGLKIGAVVIALIVAVATVPSSPKTEVAENKVEESKPQETVVAENRAPAESQAPAPIDQQITQKIKDVLGEKNNTDKPTVVSVEINNYTAGELKTYGFQPGDKIVRPLIIVNASENLTANLQKSTMHKEAAQIFQNTFPLSGEIDSIWHEPQNL